MKTARPILMTLLGTGLLLALLPNTVDKAAGSGVIVGTVRFNGEAPEARKLPIDKDNDVCGTGFRNIIDVNVGADGALGDVVVCLESDAGEPQFETPEGGFKLDHWLPSAVS